MGAAVDQVGELAGGVAVGPGMDEAQVTVRGGQRVEGGDQRGEILAAVGCPQGQHIGRAGCWMRSRRREAHP